MMTETSEELSADVRARAELRDLERRVRVVLGSRVKRLTIRPSLGPEWIATWPGAVVVECETADGIPALLRRILEVEGGR